MKIKQHNNTGQSRYYCNNNIPSKIVGGCFFFVKNVSYFLIRNSYYWRIAKKKYHLSTLFGRNNSAIVRAKVLQFICKFYITQK